jgi:hypothetical protein
VSDGGVDPKTFIAACRYAVGCDEFQVTTGGLAASPAERIRRALSALDSYVCGCMWCEMLGDRSSRTPPGPVVVSAHCAARVVHGLLDDELAQRLMCAALDAGIGAL